MVHSTVVLKVFTVKKLSDGGPQNSLRNNGARLMAVVTGIYHILSFFKLIYLERLCAYRDNWLTVHSLLHNNSRNYFLTYNFQLVITAEVGM